MFHWFQRRRWQAIPIGIDAQVAIEASMALYNQKLATLLSGCEGEIQVEDVHWADRRARYEIWVEANEAKAAPEE